MEIRVERSTDIPGVRALLLGAFPGCAEADLVERLRNDRSTVLSLVAIVNEHIVGHIMFSRMERPDGALALAPVAVCAAWRNRGVAARLIRYGLELARQEDWSDVFVLGNPAYYCRFGFDASLAAGFSSPYAGPHLMALVLRPGGVAACSGELRHPSAFAMLG
jgi:putative acetyltransferase